MPPWLLCSRCPTFIYIQFLTKRKNFYLLEYLLALLSLLNWIPKFCFPQKLSFTNKKRGNKFLEGSSLPNSNSSFLYLYFSSFSPHSLFFTLNTFGSVLATAVEQEKSVTISSQQELFQLLILGKCDRDLPALLPLFHPKVGLWV